MPTMLEDRPRAATSRGDDGAPANEVVVRVVTEDRTGSGDGSRGNARGTAARPRRFGFRGVITTVLLGAVAIGVFLLFGIVSGLLSFDPFATTQVDRTPPALLKQMHDLHQFRAARATFEVNVDVENDVDLVPSFIAGDRTSFNGIGTVDANVDFSTLSTDAVVLADDGSVAVTLPEPTYTKAVVDPARSHVMNRDRGLVDRVAGVFSDDPTSEQELYVLAGKKMDAAARESDLVAKAEANTTSMLEGLLGKLGFTNVNVTFTKALAAPADAATPRR
jgi:hypothetical protein